MPSKHMCCAINCGMRSGTNLLSQVKMYRFPKNPGRKKLWEAAVKRKDWTSHPASRLCNRHFVTGAPSSDPEDPDYVPSLFDFTENSLENFAKKKKKTRRKTDSNFKKVSSQKQSQTTTNAVHKIIKPITSLDAINLLNRPTTSTAANLPLSLECIRLLANAIKSVPQTATANQNKISNLQVLGAEYSSRESSFEPLTMTKEKIVSEDEREPYDRSLFEPLVVLKEEIDSDVEKNPCAGSRFEPGIVRNEDIARRNERDPCAGSLRQSPVVIKKEIDSEVERDPCAGSLFVPPVVIKDEIVSEDEL